MEKFNTKTPKKHFNKKKHSNSFKRHIIKDDQNIRNFKKEKKKTEITKETMKKTFNKENKNNFSNQNKREAIHQLETKLVSDKVTKKKNFHKNFSITDKAKKNRIQVIKDNNEEEKFQSTSQQRKLKKLQILKKRNPKSDIIKKMNILYNRLLASKKDKTTKKSENIVEELLVYLNDHLDVMYRNVSVSRAIQACLKYGNKDQRTLIWKNLQPKLVTLALGKYTQNLLIKLFLYGDKNMKEEIRKTLFSNPDIFFSKFGATVWEYVYTSEMISSSKQLDMLHRLVIPNLVLIQLPNAYECKNLIEVFNALDLTAKRHFVEKLSDMIQKTIDKELLNKAAVHTIIKYYAIFCNDDEKVLCYSKIEEGSFHMVSTKDGVEALCILMGYASAKQKKKFLKFFKNKIVELSCNVVDYLLISRILNIVDDSKFIGNFIIKELVSDLKTICFDKNGYKVILQIIGCVDSHRSFMNNYENYILNLKSPMSYKDAGKRREELRNLIKNDFQALFANCENFTEWIIHPWSKNVLIEYLRFTGDTNVVDGIIRDIESQLNGAQEDVSLVDHQVGHRTLLTLMRLEIQKKLVYSEEEVTNCNIEKKIEETNEIVEDEDQSDENREKELKEEEKLNSNAQVEKYYCKEETHQLCCSDGRSFNLALWNCFKAKLNTLLKTRAIFLIVDLVKFLTSTTNNEEINIKECIDVETVLTKKKEALLAGSKAKGFDLLLNVLEGKN